MAFRKKNINEIFGTVLVLSGLLSTASAVDCFGKSFHCVNSTHFMICVDLGGGVSQSIDDFLIPCPPPTVCQGSNHFECEYPAVTTPSTTLSNVKSETTDPWEEIVVTTNSPPKNTSTTKEYSEKYMNTVSITSVAENNLTTDTTSDVTTEASSLSDVNSNSNVTEIVQNSSIHEVTTGLDGITPIISDNIVTSAAEVTTATPQIIPFHQILNVTNETIIDNVTLTFSNTESTVALYNNYTITQNDSAGEVRNITAHQSANVTNKNDDIVTPNISLIESSTGTERPLTSITEESLVTGVNVVTTAQTLVSTDEFQNSPNIYIQTTTAKPAIVETTLGTEQFKKPFFEENLTTELVQNSEKEQSTVLIPDVIQNVPAQLPITTLQSTVTTVASMNVKDEVAVETTIGSDQPTNEVNFTTAHYDIYTTKAPLTIGTNGKQDTQNISVSDQVPTKLTDDTMIYSGNEQPTTDINSLPTYIVVTTEQPNTFITETQKVLVNEQPKINKNYSATEQGQKLVDKGIELPKLSQKRLTTDPDDITQKTSDLAEKTQQEQGPEHKVINKNITTTGTDAATEQGLPTEAQKSIDKDVTQSLATDNHALTDNPSEFTTEIQKLLVTEPSKINKDNSATEPVQKLIDSVIELPNSSQKRLTTNPDAITENPSDFDAETQQQQGTEHKVINKNITTTGKDAATEQVLHTEAQKPIDKDVTQSLATDNHALTDNPREFTTERQKLIVTEPSKINKDNSATEQGQKLVDKGIELPKLSPKRLTTDPDDITEKTSDLAEKTQQQQGPEHKVINKNITTTGTDAATEQVLPTGAQKPIDKDVTQSLATDNHALTDNPSEFTTERQKLLVTEPSKINKDNSATEQGQKLVDKGIELPKQSQKRLTTDPDDITEKTSDLAEKTQQQQGPEHKVINKNITMTGTDAATEQVLPTEAQKPIDKDVTQSLATDNHALTDNPSEFTTEIQKLLVTEPSKINKDNSATEPVQKLIDSVIELPNSSQKRLTTNPDAITENPSDLAAETQRQQRTEKIIINKNIITTGNDTRAEASVLPTAAQNPIDKGVEQSKDSTQNLATVNDALTENPSEFTTETPKQAATPLTTNKNSTATDNHVITEASVLPLEAQTPIPKRDEQRKISTVGAVTTVTQKSIYMSTKLLTTIRSDLLTDTDITTEKAGIYITDTHEPRKQITEEEKPTTNKNYLAIDNYGIAKKTSEFTTEAQKLTYTGTDQLITRTKSTATDMVAENSVLSIETQNPIYMSSSQPITSDIDVSVEKANVFTIATPKPISMSTEHPTTIKNYLATDIKVTTETGIGSAKGTSKPTIHIQEELALGLSDHNIVTEKQNRESFTTDTIPYGVITTDAVVTESAGVTEQPIATVLEGSIVTDNNISNFTELQNNISSNIEATGTIVVQSINTTTATTTESTTIKIADDNIKEETTAFTSSVKASNSDEVNKLPVDNDQPIHNIIIEQLNPNTPEVTAGTVASVIPTTEKSVNIKNMFHTSTAESMPNLSNGHQLSSNIDTSDITNAVTTDTSFSILNEINIPINENANSETTLAFEINKAINPNTVKSMQDTQSVVEIVDKNQHTTESNFKVTGTAFTTIETETHNNGDESDVGISNNAAVNEHMSITDKVNSELHITERLIPAENIGNQLPATETTATTDLGSISTFNLNPGIDFLNSNIQEDINNKPKNSNSAYSGKLSGAEATSETTATDKFTPSLNPNNESSQKDKYVTSNNPVTTGNTNIMIENLADGTSSFSMASNTILKEKDDDSNKLLTENENIYKTTTSLNTQDKSYVSLTTEKSVTSHDNVADKQVPKLTTISENETHETIQLSIPTNDFKPIPVNNAKNYVDDFTSLTSDIGNTGTAFTQKLTTVGGIDLESHLLNKNGIDQHALITTQTFGTEQLKLTIAPNKNMNNLLSNPPSNILLDKINQAVKPATESSTHFPTKNDGNINSMDTLSFGTNSIVDGSSIQLPHTQNTNDVTTQASIPMVRTIDNLPSSSLDSQTATDAIYKTKYSASITKTENPPVIQFETSPKETSTPKEDLFLNSGNVLTPSAIPMTDSTTEFSIKESVKNVYKTIESYFNTPSETSTPGSLNGKESGDINPILSQYDLQDSTKTRSSMYNTESSLYAIKNSYDSLISKLGPVSTVSNLQPPVTYSGFYTKANKIEMTTEASKNNDEGNIVLKKPVIMAALPVHDYKIKMNTANIKPIPIASEDTKTSESKTLQEDYSSATYRPSKFVTEKSHTSISSKSSGSTVNISSEASVSSQQNINAFKTDVKSLSGQSNKQNVVPSQFEYNSSFYADTANSGSKSTDFKSSNNSTNAANKQSHSKSQLNSTIFTSQVTEKVGLATNTTKNVNSKANDNKLSNNSSFRPSTITVTLSKNVPRDINKNGSSFSRNPTNTTKANTQGVLELKQKTTTNSTEHDSGQAKPTTTKQEKIHSVITTSQAPVTKITPRPVTPITKKKNPSKQITNTGPVNYSCINGIRGRYSDKGDCRKFYICIGISQPIVGNCPVDTVFSDISKLCTKNLSHCIRENEFKCPSAGRFSDVIKDNIYYICVSHKARLYRFKFQCQKGFTLNKTTTRCEENRQNESNQSVFISLSENSNDGSISSKTSTSSSSSSSSSSDSSSMSTSSDSSSSSSKDSSSGDSNSNSSSSKDTSSSNSDSSSSKSKEKKESKEKPEGKEGDEGDEEDEVFECEKEGKFPVRNDCRRYYLCKKNGKSEYRRKIKKCESGDVFHKGKKNSKNSRESSDSESDDDRRPSKRRQRKEKKEEPAGREDGVDDQEVFECEREGKFPVPGDCRRYFLCKKNRKSQYRRKIKKCDSDEVFHKSKKKCVDADSYEC